MEGNFKCTTEDIFSQIHNSERSGLFLDLKPQWHPWWRELKLRILLSVISRLCSLDKGCSSKSLNIDHIQRFDLYHQQNTSNATKACRRYTARVHQRRVLLWYAARDDCFCGLILLHESQEPRYIGRGHSSGLGGGQGFFLAPSRIQNGGLSF